jgi:hypothetical protein
MSQPLPVSILDRYRERAKPLVDACEVIRTYDQPWLANRDRGIDTIGQ